MSSQPPIPMQTIPAQPPPPNINANIVNSSQHDIHNLQNEILIDPIVKCKELMPQLKEALKNLLQQLAIFLNPNSEISKPQAENLFQILGRNIDNFYRICDLMIVNLRVACEVQQIQIISNQYSIAVESKRDPNDSVNRLIERIQVIRSALQRYLSQKYEA